MKVESTPQLDKIQYSLLKSPLTCSHYLMATSTSQVTVSTLVLLHPSINAKRSCLTWIVHFLVMVIPLGAHSHPPIEFTFVKRSWHSGFVQVT